MYFPVFPKIIVFMDYADAGSDRIAVRFGIFFSASPFSILEERIVSEPGHGSDPSFLFRKQHEISLNLRQKT
jgi:hypothetical protein